MARKPRSDAAAHRDRILDAAATVFDREGYDVPLDRIVREAGVGRATLYRNFAGRLDLLVAVWVSTIQETERRVRAHRDDATLLAMFLERQGLLSALNIRVLSELGADPDGRHAFDQVAARAATLMQDIVERSHRAGTLRSDAGVRHLRLALRMLFAANSKTLSGDREELLGDAMRIILDGLAPRIAG